MAESLKLAGKKLPLESGVGSEWKFVVRPGGWIIAERELADGGRIRRRVAIQESAGRLSAHLSGITYSGEISRSSSGAGGAAAGSEADLVAQFPGKVRKVLVTQGEQVEEGQPLLMVEAMKMEFPVKAPFAGKITNILVQDGQQLSPGDRFLDLEAKSDG